MSPDSGSNLRDVLIDEAIQLLREENPESLSLREVARRAGVSHMAPYNHFDGKAGLIAAVATRGFRGLTRRMKARMNAVEEPRLKLKASGLGYIEYALKNEPQFRLMFGPAVSDKSAYPELQEAGRESFEVLEDIVARCQQHGIVEPAGLEEKSYAAWSMVHGFATLVIDGQFEGDGSWESVANEADRISDVLWQGLGIRPPQE
jgi:AcrR family transcriptional regulator